MGYIVYYIFLRGQWNAPHRPAPPLTELFTFTSFIFEYELKAMFFPFHAPSRITVIQWCRGIWLCFFFCSFFPFYFDLLVLLFSDACSYIRTWQMDSYMRKRERKPPLQKAELDLYGFLFSMSVSGNDLHICSREIPLLKWIMNLQ